MVEFTSEFIPQRALPWGVRPKQTFSPGKRTKENPFSHKKKLILSCNPLDMNVPFEIYLAFSKS